VSVVLPDVADIAGIWLERTSWEILDFMNRSLTVPGAVARWSPMAAGLPAPLIDR